MNKDGSTGTKSVAQVVRETIRMRPSVMDALKLQIVNYSALARILQSEIEEGSLEAILGDEVVTLGLGDTVLAPAGVKHGFVNRSQATAKLLAAFPKTQFERVAVE